MNEKIERWLSDHPNGEVRLNRNGSTLHCALAVCAQDCYFGMGPTVEAAFDDALAIFESYDSHVV